ncbi:LysR family transcriptional regulator [Ramlibacter sp. MAHUQ-53]|uniref:LysR family transcriptional regulator n=1 Tax=unclassified Ramlibacter TaxID=2617605 RepID=UPI00362D83D9
MQRLDPVSLKLFVRVIEAGTIAAAADSEHIAAAAVSKRLAEIEAHLGTQLLVRTNKGVEPTAAGLALQALARRALHELDQIPVQMQGYASGVRGLVRVCASMSAITQFLPADIRSFRDQYPGVQVQLEERTSTRVTRLVADNAADLGIYNSAPHDPALATLPYHRDRLVVCAPRPHPLAARASVRFEDIAAEEIIGMHTGSAIGGLLSRAAGAIERPLRMRMQVTSFDALCMMVHNRLGVGVLPDTVARRNAVTLDIAVVPLEDAWARREFTIAMRQDESTLLAARLLASHLQARAAATGPAAG